MIIRLWATLFFVVLSCGLVIAIDEETIAKNLSDAVREYDKTIEKVKSEMLKELDNQAKAAKKAGMLTKLEELEAEKEKLEKKNEMPKSFKTDVFPKKVSKAREKLENTYNKTISEYTKMDGKLDLAKSTKKQLEEFQKGELPFSGIILAAGRKTLSDILSKGTTLSGTFTQGPNQDEGEFRITINERDGNKFKATYVTVDKDGRTRDWTGVGQITGDEFTWDAKTPGIGANGKLSLKNDKLEGKWSNSSKVSGTITLKLPK
jgi:hypothetical protein